MGTRELEIGSGGEEFLDIVYADGEKLYIPMDGLMFIQKYVGSGEAPPPSSVKNLESETIIIELDDKSSHFFSDKAPTIFPDSVSCEKIGFC